MYRVSPHGAPYSEASTPKGCGMASSEGAQKALEHHCSRGPTRTAGAAAVTVWLSPGSGVYNRQEVKRQRSRRDRYFSFPETKEDLGKHLFTSVSQSKGVLGFQITYFALTQFHHRLFFLMLNRPDGYSSYHSVGVYLKNTFPTASSPLYSFTGTFSCQPSPLGF